MREAGRVICPKGHCFDIARSGYINLLQPQDRRSRQPGDTPEALAARRSLHDSGVTSPLLADISSLLSAQQDDVVLDVGCGDGFYLESLRNQSEFVAHGLDISTRSMETAARQYPNCEWIVANADRFVPYAERSFSKVMSLMARMNSSEFARILRPMGRLLVALPAPNDLIELRGSGRDRTERTIQAFAPNFTLIDRIQTTTTAHLDESAIKQVLHSIYRPLQAAPLKAGLVTFSLDLLLFELAASD